MSSTAEWLGILGVVVIAYPGSKKLAKTNCVEHKIVGNICCIVIQQHEDTGMLHLDKFLMGTSSTITSLSFLTI